MDSSDLRLLIGLLFGAFLAIVVLSDLAKRRAKGPRIRVKPKTGGFRRSAMPEIPPDGGFRARATPQGDSRTGRNDFKVARR